MKIAVLAGGLSPEREVSLTSGSMIANALIRKGHSVAFVDLYTGKGMDQCGFGSSPRFTSDEIATYRVGASVPDLDALMRESGRGEKRIGEGVIDICREADVVFNALHGDVGENGQLQALLDMEGINYTGSGYIGSMLAMDKDISKRILSGAGISTPFGVAYELGHSNEERILEICEDILARIGLPCVIKPCSCGSSVGISMPESREELERAVASAAKYEDRILAEEKIVGRELTVSILGDRVLPPVEIVPLNGFYDYENKYQSGRTEEICPPRLSKDESARLGEISRSAFRALRLGGYARFDYIEDANGEFWCLEANTLPGMTPTSLLPLAASVDGIDYDTLCDTMAKMALD